VTNTSTIRYSTKTNLPTTQYKIKHDLRAVADRLNRDYKRPKCMTDHDFCLPMSKKARKYHPYSLSLTSSQCSSDSEDFEGRRSQHNVMERQRRNELKLSLHGLRDCLPSLHTQDKAPKVVILAHATNYVSELQAEDHRLTAEIKDLRSKNRSLKERLAELEGLLDLSM